MSVILFGEEKFLRVYKTLKGIIEGSDLGYPNYLNENCLKRVLGSHNESVRGLKRFCQRLADLNVEAYNQRYDDGNEKRYELDFGKPIDGYNSVFELLKSLNSIDYNSLEAEEKNFEAEKLVNLLRCAIVEALPQYDKAEWTN